MEQHETRFFSESGFKHAASTFSSICGSSNYAWGFLKLIDPLQPCWTPGPVIPFPNTHRGATFKVKAAKMEREETRHVFIGHTQANLKSWKHRPHWLLFWKLWFHTMLGPESPESVLQCSLETDAFKISVIFIQYRDYVSKLTYRIEIQYWTWFITPT